MKIALTGTPGTGKTSVARELKERGFEVVDLTEYVKEKDLGTPGEEFEVDVPEMVNALEQEPGTGDTVIEGHLAHHFPADYCIVLRTRPDVLRERLEQREYSEEKIDENVESEALDVGLQEAVQKQEDIIEVDTTGREPKDVAGEIERRIEKEEAGYGDIDWSEYL
ncbi:MAG: adenylate kinase family protein [Candidatus Nanohaloarchaea archaeon]